MMNNHNEMERGLFRQLEPMLADRAVLITVSAIEGHGGRLQVNICPRLLKDGENKSLTVPLCVTGTASELDAELVSQVAAYVESHGGLTTNLNQIQAEVAEAEKAAREEAAKKKRNVASGGKKVDPAATVAKETQAGPPPQQSLGLFDAVPEQPVES